MSILNNIANDIASSNLISVNSGFTALKGLASAVGVGAIAGPVLDEISKLVQKHKATLNPVMGEIQTGFDKLQQAQRGSDIVARLRDLSRIWAEAQAIQEGLIATVNANPPVDTGARIAQIAKCREALDNLSGPPPQTGGPWPGPWLAPIDDGPYFDDTGTLRYTMFAHDVDQSKLIVDVGYGPQIPDQEVTGATFSYTYVLPLFLYVENIFLTAGSALLPGFVEQYQAAIQADASFLQGVHDHILAAGIRSLAPSWQQTPDIIFNTWVGASSKVSTRPGGVSQVINGPRLRGDYPPIINEVEPDEDWWLAGVRMDCGAVEVFSGANVTSRYILRVDEVSPHERIQLYPPGSQTPPELRDIEPGLGTNHKFRIRFEHLRKTLYRAVGLDRLSEYAQVLRHYGSVAPTKPNYGEWSLADLCAIAGLDALGPDLHPSVRKLAAFLHDTAAHDIPVPPIQFPPMAHPLSLRELLEGYRVPG